MKVVLIRHTRVDVPKGTCYGWSDVPVAETFVQEAAVTKAKLQRYPAFDAVYSSPLSRAHRLATFCGYPNAIIDNRLKEINMGDWEMQLYDDIEKKDPAIHAWFDDYIHLAATNGESFPMVYRRVSCFLEELRGKPYERVAVFAHGGVLICAGIFGGLFTEEHAFEHLVDYGGIEEIDI